MTADRSPGGDRSPAGPVTVDLFLVGRRPPHLDAAAALRQVTRYARAAEAAGFDGVWLAEHHFTSYGVCPSAVALAAFLLGQTTGLRVGTAAAILSNRHPVALAEEAALLDAVSGGRFDLGVARGGPWVDLEVFGTGLSRYTTGFAEALDLMLAALSTGQVRADGEHFRFRAVPVLARPVPVLVAATSPSTVDIAAGRGLPLLLGMHDGVAAKAAMLDRYAVAAARAGHVPAAVAHASAHLVHVAPTVESARAELAKHMPDWLARTREHVRIDGTSPPRRDLDAYLEHLLDIHPIGPAEVCVERLAASVARTAVRRLLLVVEGCPQRTEEVIEQLGADVLPAVRATARAGGTGH